MAPCRASSTRDGATLNRVITEAEQNAQRHGDRAVEIHVVAPELSLAQATDALRATPVPFRSWLARVVIQVPAGHFQLPPPGCP